MKKLRVEKGPQRAVLSQREAVPEFRETDEDDREQGLLIPLVVCEDVQVIEDVLPKQVGLVEEQDRMHGFTPELLDVGADRVEDRGSRRLGREAERDAELAIEVATAERRVMAVGQAKAGLRESTPERARKRLTAPILPEPPLSG